MIEQIYLRGPGEGVHRHVLREALAEQVEAVCQDRVRGDDLVAVLVELAKLGSLNVQLDGYGLVARLVFPTREASS